MNPNKVIFYTVLDNPAKIQLICQKAQESINQEKKLLITVPNLEAANYIDALLWKTPTESFNPHVISQNVSKEWIVITCQSTHNLNQAAHLLNLCPQANPIFKQFEEVYELLDETSPEKKSLSLSRLDTYKASGTFVKVV